MQFFDVVVLCLSEVVVVPDGKDTFVGWNRIPMVQVNPNVPQP